MRRVLRSARRCGVSRRALIANGPDRVPAHVLYLRLFQESERITRPGAGEICVQFIERVSDELVAISFAI